MIELLKNKNVRIIYNENEEWFHAGDIEKVLGRSNIRTSFNKIPKGNVRKFTNPIVKQLYNRNFSEDLNNTGENFLNPHAVYFCAFRSNNPKAMEFTQWVADVIEYIRKNGYYITIEKDEKWLGVRGESKKQRLVFTDEVKEFVHYAMISGSSKSEKYYTHFTNLINKKAGVPKGSRDHLTQEKMREIMVYEGMIALKLPKLIDKDTEYHDIYQQIKKIINEI